MEQDEKELPSCVRTRRRNGSPAGLLHGRRHRQQRPTTGRAASELRCTDTDNFRLEEGDLALLAEIIAESFVEWKAARRDGEPPFCAVLRAYDIVLRRSGLDPAVDILYYRALLRLSLLGSEDGWWSKLSEVAQHLGLRLPVASARSYVGAERTGRALKKNASATTQKSATATFILDHADAYSAFKWSSARGHQSRENNLRKEERGNPTNRNLSREKALQGDAIILAEAPSARNSAAIAGPSALSGVTLRSVSLDVTGTRRLRKPIPFESDTIDDMELSQVLNSYPSCMRFLEVDDLGKCPPSPQLSVTASGDGCAGLRPVTVFRDLPPVLPKSDQAKAEDDILQSTTIFQVPLELVQSDDVLRVKQLRPFFKLWQSQTRWSADLKAKHRDAWIRAVMLWRRRLLRQAFRIWRLCMDAELAEKAARRAQVRLSVLHRAFRRFRGNVVCDRLRADEFYRHCMMLRAFHVWSRRYRLSAKVAALKSVADHHKAVTIKRRTFLKWLRWSRKRQILAKKLGRFLGHVKLGRLRIFFEILRSNTARKNNLRLQRQRSTMRLLRMYFAQWRGRLFDERQAATTLCAFQYQRGLMLRRCTFCRWVREYSFRKASSTLELGFKSRIVNTYWHIWRIVWSACQDRLSAELFFNRIVTRKALHRWIGVLSKLKVVEDHGRLFAQEATSHLLARTFKMWCLELKYRRADSAARVSFIFDSGHTPHRLVGADQPAGKEPLRALVENRFRKRFFLRWVAVLADFHARCRQAELIHGRALLQRVWNTLRATFRKLNACYSLAVNSSARFAIRKYFGRWRVRCGGVRRIAQQTRMKAVVFAEWRKQVSKTETDDELFQIVSAKYQYLLIRSMFQWWGNRFRGIELDNAMAKGRNERVLERCIFQRWRSLFAERRSEKEAIRSFEDKRLQLVGMHVLAAWRLFSSKCRQDIRKQNAFRERLRLRMLSKYVGIWRTSTRDQILARKLREYCRAQRFLLLKSVFAYWRIRYLKERAVRHRELDVIKKAWLVWRIASYWAEKSNAADCHHESVVKKSAWNKWIWNYYSQIAMPGCKQIECDRLRDICFAKLRKNVAINRRQEEAVPRIRRRLLLQAALRTMLHSFRRKSIMDAGLSKLQQKGCRRLASKAFNIWRGRHARVANYTTAAENRCKTRILCSSFYDWRDRYALVSIALFETSVNVDRRIMRNAFNSWRAALWAMRRRKAGHKVIEKRQSAVGFAVRQTLKKTVRTWRESIDHQNRALHEAERLFTLSRMRMWFGYWRRQLLLVERANIVIQSISATLLDSAWWQWAKRLGSSRARKLDAVTKDRWRLLAAGFVEWRRSYIRREQANKWYELHLRQVAFSRMTAVMRGRRGLAEFQAMSKHRTVGASWRRWRDMAKQRRKRRNIAEFCIRLRRRKVKAVFCAYRDFVRRRRSVQRVLADMRKFAQTGRRGSPSDRKSDMGRSYCPWLLRRMLRTWIHQYERACSRRNEKEGIVRGYEKARSWRLQRWAFAHWQNRLNRVQQNRRLDMLRRMVFVLWRQHSRMLHVSRVTYLKGVFDRWRDLSRLYTEAAGQASYAWRLRILRRSFNLLRQRLALSAVRPNLEPDVHLANAPAKRRQDVTVPESDSGRSDVRTCASAPDIISWPVTAAGEVPQTSNLDTLSIVACASQDQIHTSSETVTQVGHPISALNGHTHVPRVSVFQTELKNCAWYSMETGSTLYSELAKDSTYRPSNDRKVQETADSFDAGDNSQEAEKHGPRPYETAKAPEESKSAEKKSAFPTILHLGQGDNPTTCHHTDCANSNSHQRILQWAWGAWRSKLTEEVFDRVRKEMFADSWAQVSIKRTIFDAWKDTTFAGSTASRISAHLK